MHYLPASGTHRNPSHGGAMLIRDKHLPAFKVETIFIPGNRAYLVAATSIGDDPHTMWSVHGPHGSARNRYWQSFKRLAMDFQQEGKSVTLIVHLNVVYDVNLDRANHFSRS